MGSVYSFWNMMSVFLKDFSVLSPSILSDLEFIIIALQCLICKHIYRNGPPGRPGSGYFDF